jgi:hypothetical protein
MVDRLRKVSMGRGAKRRTLNKIDVYFEIGKKKTFAGAIDWPGWSRSGGDEASALQGLFDYGPRYAHVLRNTRLGFKVPEDVSAFRVAERLEGNATTDFGAPGLAPASDAEPVDSVQLKRFQKILKACGQAFDANVKAATGKALQTGPRGGGRELEGILQHLLGSDAGYVAQVGWRLEKGGVEDVDQQLDRTRQGILKGLTSSARGEIPARGPRGGLRWSPRYFVRRVAWHVLDHAWELEDRIVSG